MVNFDANDLNCHVAEQTKMQVKESVLSEIGTR
jgi:hypothetical protein